MKKITIYIVLAALCLNLKVRAQDKSSHITALKIGDEVPDITITNIINYPTKPAKISDFKGKLLILDFWATWCSSCIANFPKMEALQKEFGDKIQILAVAYEDSKKINGFFASKAGQGYHVTSIVNDSTFSKLFPHRVIPHCVWIDKDGVVTAITSAEEVTSININKILNKEKNITAAKIDIDPHEPLFIGKDLLKEQLVQYSILLKGKNEGLPTGSEKRTKNGIAIGLAVMNDPILTMYKIVMWRLMPGFVESRLIIDSRNVEALKDDIYSYDLILPKELSDSLYRYMLNDLNRYTNYHARIEHRKMDCLILTKESNSDKIRTGGGQPENSLFFNRPARLINHPVSDLLIRLNDVKGINLPIVDETHYNGNIDLEFSGNTDLESIKKSLKSYGLILTEGERNLEVFVIGDKNIKLSANTEHD